MGVAKSIDQLSLAASVAPDDETIVNQPSTAATITATTISADGDDNSFNDSANGFIAAGFEVGMRVKSSGFTGNAANNIHSGVITALTAGKMTIGGTDGDVLVDDAAGESVTITKWETFRTPLASFTGGPGTRTGLINFVVDGQGSVITTGFKDFSLPVPYAHEIVGVTLLSCDSDTPTSGSIEIEIWADTYANYPPSVADKITASAPPTISSATKARDTTLTGWTTTIAADTIYGFKVNSVTSLKKVKVLLEVLY